MTFSETGMPFESCYTKHFDMASRTLGTVIILIICILLFPITIGLIGGAFGIVMGVFGIVFGALFGMIGGIIGGIFGFFNWIFGGIFNWDHHYGFFHFNFCAAAFIVILVLVLSRNRRIKK
jgi:hypothetical protein